MYFLDVSVAMTQSKRYAESCGKALHCCSSKAVTSSDTYYGLVQNCVCDFSNVGNYGMA